jgi:hypothetical protein
MKPILLLFIGIFFLHAVYSQEITIVKKNKAKSSIVIPDKPTAMESKAATVLQDYLQQISGAKLNIVSDKESPQGAEILIGKVNRAEMQGIETAKLAKDGFTLRNSGNKLVIAGGTEKGVLYGVYTLLENYLGVRKYSSKVSIIPKSKSIVLKSINETQVPSFDFRRIEYRDANVGEFADWNRVTNGRDWGTWCHTFAQLLSPAEYGTSHPEYFSFYNGSRHPENTPNGSGTSQLCLSNPEVLNIVAKNLKTRIERNPGAKYWSVSQNDNVNYCRCPECTRLDAQYAAATSGDTYATGTMKYASTGMGSMMYFINKLAAQFPDKVISTLAYQYTRKPPENIIPANNINIMLCSIESPRDVPMDQGDVPFAKDLAGWGRLSKDILVWDYTIQFRHLLAPFPNLRTLQPNIQFLYNNGVTALFEQGNRQWGGESAELRAYLITKLMWNKDINVSAVMDDFLNGYYGKAGKLIRQYIDISHDKMEQTKTRLTIFGTPVQAKETFLSDSLIRVYNNLFDRAEKAVSNSPEILERVKTARLPVYYAMLEIAKSDKTGPRGAYTVDPQGKQIPNPQIVDILNKFVSQCIATGVPRIAEWNTTPQDYMNVYNAFLEGKPAPAVQRFH